MVASEEDYKIEKGRILLATRGVLPPACKSAVQPAGPAAKREAVKLPRSGDHFTLSLQQTVPPEGEYNQERLDYYALYNA